MHPTELKGTHVAHQELVAKLEAAAISFNLEVQEVVEAESEVDKELQNARERVIDAEKVCSPH